MRKTQILCDHCGTEFSENRAAEGVTNVCAKIGGNGAAEENFGPSDLCRACYSRAFGGLKSVFRETAAAEEPPAQLKAWAR